MENIKSSVTSVLDKNLSKNLPKNSSYDEITLEAITNIVKRHTAKEKSNYNIEKSDYKLTTLEDELRKRYSIYKSNNFPFPEIKHVLDCIADILTYFKDNHYIKDEKMKWQIDQTINIIKNASQETACADIKFDSCPPEDTISTIKSAKDLKYFNIKNENVIFRHGKENCDYNVYETPYRGNLYPYAYCIRVVIESLNMIDLINIDIISKKDKNIWQTNYATVYFKERYHYYLDYLLDNAPDVFILPILQKVGATALIRNRCSRIQPCGVIFDEAFVDEDMQTPCNFFWHDINHARRIYQNNLWYSKQNNIQIDKFYKNMREDVDMLMPIKSWLTDTKYESLIKILLFEVVHEDALPFNKDSIIDDILFKSGNCYPYERTYDNEDNDNSYNRINLRFYEQGASTLRTIYNKLRHTFFEKEEAYDIIATKDLRYIKHMIEASYILLNKIDPSKYNEKSKDIIVAELKTLLTDKTFQAHNAIRLKGVNTDSQDNDIRLITGVKSEPQLKRLLKDKTFQANARRLKGVNSDPHVKPKSKGIYKFVPSP